MISPVTGIPAGPEWKQFLHLSEELVRQPTAADQCRLIASTVGQLTRSQVEVWLVHPFYPLPGESYARVLPAPDAPAMVQRAYAQREPCCPDGSAFDPNCSCGEDGPRQVAFPVITQGFMLAIITLERSPEQDAFTPADLNYLEGLAAHAAMAMQISRQVTIKNWRNEQLTLVRSVSAQISYLLDIDELCQRVTRLIQQTFHYYYVTIFTLEGPGAEPRFRASAVAASAGSAVQQYIPVALGEGMVGYVAEHGEELLAPDVREESRYRAVDALPNTRSELALPLKVENRVLGVLDVQSDQPDAFHEVDMLVLRSLADNIALAIEGARLYSTAQHRTAQISAVLEVSHALSSILDLDELLEEIVQVIHRRFGYPYVHLFTVHPGRRLIFYRAGSGSRAQAYHEQSLTYDLDAPRGIIPWVARSGETVIANDVTLEAHYLPTGQAPYETGSELTIPLKVNNEVLGVLDIQHNQTGAFDENDRTLLEALSTSVAVALRNATLYRSEVWRRQVAESFRDVAEMLPSSLEPEALLEKVLVALEQNLPCDASAIWLLAEDDKGKPRLQLAAARGVTPQHLLRTRPRTGNWRAWFEAAIKKPYPAIRAPGERYDPLGVALDFPGDYSSIVAPMRAGDKVLGVLVLAHHTARRYGSEARDMTATFASYAAVAIQNARLYHESQEQAWISTLLLQVAEANQSVSTLEDMLNNTIQLIPLLVGVKKAAIFVWEPLEDAFSLSAASGIDLPEGSARFPIREAPALATLAATRSPVYVQDAAIDLKLPQAAPPQGGALLLMPLLARNELQGALLVAYRGTARGRNTGELNDRMLAILQGVTHQTATAIENIRLVEARQEEAYVTAVLLQVAQAVVTLNDLNDILDTITHLMPILVGIDACIIYLWDRDAGVFAPSQAFAGLHQAEREILARAYAPGDFRLLDEVQRSDTHILSPLANPDLPPAEWPGLPCLPPGSLPTPGMASIGSWLIGVPLSIKGEFYGVMLAKESDTPAVFREQRLEIISGIAQEVALAIQNDRLQRDMVLRERIEREVQLAREIQRTFLPDHLPTIPGWQLDATWQTARTVGGDFYDVFLIDDHRVGIVIADVADKGMPAALYMTVTRTLIRASLQTERTPARVLERVNNLLVPDAQNGMFVTAVFAILDTRSGELTYANAGHNLPRLVRGTDGSVQQLSKGGMALGVMPNMPMHDETITIQPGDCLVLFTDGVTEAFSATDEPFGEARLEDVLARAGHCGTRETLDAVDQALVTFRAGNPLSDDITLIAIYREPV